MKIFLTIIATLVFIFGTFGQSTTPPDASKTQVNNEKVYQDLKELVKDAQSDFAPIRGKVVSKDANEIVYQTTKKYFQSFGCTSQITYHIEARLYELSFLCEQDSKILQNVLYYDLEKNKKIITSTVLFSTTTDENYSYQKERIAKFLKNGEKYYVWFYSNPPAWMAINEYISPLSAAQISENVTGLKTTDKKNWDELLERFSNLYKRTDDFDSLLKSCQESAQKREFTKAIEFCSEAITQKKDSGIAYYIRAFSYNKTPYDTLVKSPTGETVKITGELRKQFIVSDAEKCAQLIPNEYPCFSLLGENLYKSDKKDELEKAVKNLSEGIRLGDKNKNLILYRATANFALAKTFKPIDANAKKYAEQALADYANLIQLNPKDDYNYLRRSDVYEFLGKYDLAIADLSKFLETNEKDDEAIANRGKLYLANKQYQPAIDDFTKALEIAEEEENSNFEDFQKEILPLRMQAYKALKMKKQFCEDVKTLDVVVDCDKEWKKN